MKHLVEPTSFHDVLCTTREREGFVHHSIATVRRTSASLGIYVAHPITGIRISRIHAMQDEVRAEMADAGRLHGVSVHPFFPIRTNHLGPDGIGDNVYEAGANEFSAARHFTLQNRLDAVVHSDGVLVHLDVRDDEGNYRRSNGIPFDVGWAEGAGRPAVVVEAPGSPNRFVLAAANHRTAPDLAEGVRTLVGMAVAGIRTVSLPTVVAEVLEMPDSPSPAALVELARSDVRRHRDGCRAILAVMPGGRANPNFHGQVGEIADWVVEDEAAAWSIVRRLLAAG